MTQPQRPLRTPGRVPPRRTPAGARPYGQPGGRRHSGCGFIGIALLAVIVIAGVYIFGRVQRSLASISIPDVRPTATVVEEVAQGEVVQDDASNSQDAVAPTPALLRSPFKVLVIGVDLREARPDEGARSDTLIVVHIDPVEKWASMLSIPRDSLAAIPNSVCANAAATKINAAYACGWQHPEIYGQDDTPANRQQAGAALAAETVEDFLGVKIDYTAQVDFRGFEALVDALGGVTLDVPKTILDAEYPTEDNGYMRLYIPAGLQRMDGVTALRYARTRHADNDFGRAARQQQVLQGLLDEIKRRGLLDQIELAPQLLDIAARSIRTTLELNPADVGMMAGLIELARDIGPDRIQRLQLKPEINADGTSCILSDLESVIQWNPDCVERLVLQLQSPPVEEAAGPAVIQVQNGTFTPRLAGQVTTDLEVAGYLVARAADAPEKGIPSTIILNYTGKDDTVQELATRFSVPPENIEEADPATAPPNVDIVVRLGDDYQPPTGSEAITP